MIITGSTVSMSSERMFSSSEYSESMTIEMQDPSKYLENVQALSENNGKGLVQSMRDYEKQEEKDRKTIAEQNKMKSMMEYLDRMRKSQNENRFDISDETELQIKLLRKLLAALSGKGRLDPFELEEMKKGDVLDLRSSNLKKADMITGIRGESAEGKPKSGNDAGPVAALKVGTGVSGTVWHRITAVSGFYSESEYTSFESKGLVSTADGRSISFGVEVNMSRSFMEQIDAYSDQTYIRTDPLIINMDTNIASVSDMKFRFDLDGDGKKENISFAGEGSGFLALDKNGNGKIDDGTELFGTASGDGFRDLAAYDEDGNMWIDENDSIFKDLRVWIKDSEGNDKLIDLASADVGAIYLGNAGTEFSLKNDAMQTNAIIQKTGIYLKESGGVGTVNHVDLTY